ncbi:MAG: hypothetical protein IPO91_21895 [Chloroflexi bacterium]|nr:hypothetical protein [Chloroflexota bacterium]
MSEMRNTPEQLAARLDRVLPPGTTFTPPRTKDPLVNTAIDVADTPFPALSNEASQRIEARMLAAFDQQFPAQNGKVHKNGARPSTAQPSIALVPKQRRSPVPIVLRWAAAAVLILVILSGGLTAASASAVPGDTLYPVKRAVEQVELVFARTSADRAEVLLQQARRRAEEALVLTVRREDTNTVLMEARQNLNEAERLAPELMTQPAFAQSITAINAVIDAVDGSSVPPGQAPEGEQPSGLPLLAESETPTPSVTPSPTRTPRTRVPATDETDESASATRTPRPTNTPRPTHVPPTQAQGGQQATNPPQGNPPADPGNGNSQQATNCPGNSCSAQATNPPQGNPPADPGGGNPPVDPGGGNNGNNGNGSAANPPGDPPGVADQGNGNSNAGGNGNNGNNGNG